MKRFVSLFFIIVAASSQTTLFAQCPTNIGFESGTLNGWEGALGSVDATGTLQLSTSSLPDSRHVLYKASVSQELDPYGKFPVTCPNGSLYSVKLGDDLTGKGAESMSYTFTVPSNQKEYGIIYNYAVVFQNPSHQSFEQPRFTAKVYDGITGANIGCSSFEFVASGGLPGFQLSSQGKDVYYKPWSPITINLSGYQGRTIRIEFTTNDCTKGGHFGYAYIDVNENCASPISGNVFCQGDTAMTLTAPFGFSDYNWFPADFSKVLGTKNTLTLKPPPLPGTKIALEIIPYLGLGCLDTLYTSIVFSPDKINFTLKTSIEACSNATVDLTQPFLTAGSDSAIKLSYFYDAGGLNYLTLPEFVKPGNTYYINAINTAGCHELKPIDVLVIADPAVNITQPAFVTFPKTVDITRALTPSPNVTYSYWYDKPTTVTIPFPTRVDTSGTFYIKGVNATGCINIQPVSVLINPSDPVKINAPTVFSPNNDGLHDKFVIEMIGVIKLNSFSIYNRAGQPVFETQDITRVWDGNFNAQPLPIGTYYWVFDGVDVYKKQHIIKSGSITLLR